MIDINFEILNSDMSSEEISISPISFNLKELSETLEKLGYYYRDTYSDDRYPTGYFVYRARKIEDAKRMNDRLIQIGFTGFIEKFPQPEDFE